MRRILFIAVLVLVCGCFAVAQDYPKAELEAGWNYLHIDEGSGGTQNGVPGGFFIDGTYYFVKVLGLTGDFEYNKKTFSEDANFTSGDQARAFSFHAGPRVKARMGRFEPFAHALFGVTNFQFTTVGGPSVSRNAFSMKIGGGLDMAFSAPPRASPGRIQLLPDQVQRGSELQRLGYPEQLHVQRGRCYKVTELFTNPRANQEWLCAPRKASFCMGSVLLLVWSQLVCRC